MRIKPAVGALASGIVLSLAATLGVTTTAGAAVDDRSADPSAAAAKQALAAAQDALSGNAKKPNRDATMALRDLWLTKDALQGADARTARAMLSRPTTEPQDSPYDIYYGAGVPVKSECSEDLCLHWVETANANGDAATPAYAAETLANLQQVHDAYVAAGYKPTLPDEGQEGNTKPDVYLSNIGDMGLYGYCTSDAADFTDGLAVYAYCVLDNDYSPEEFPGPITPIGNMQVTAAHEYFHAVQYAYNALDDTWIYETTATWAEDEIYDDINDNWYYLPTGQLGDPNASQNLTTEGPGVSLDTGDFAYGNWIFHRYLSEKFDSTVVRDIWRALDSTGGKTPGYSMQAVESVLQDRGTTMKDQYGQFALDNNTPALTYEEGADYPYPAYAFKPVKLSKGKKSASKTVTLDHLTSGTGAFLPFAKGYKLKVSVDLTDKKAGSMAAVAVYNQNGQIDRSWIKLDKKGDGSKTVPFASNKVAGVEVTLVNASTEMVQCGTDLDFWRYSCGGFGKYENQKQKVTVKAFK